MNAKQTYEDYLQKLHQKNVVKIKLERQIQSFKIKYNIEQEIGDIDTIYIELSEEPYPLINVYIFKDKYRDTWEISFHDKLCEEFNLKLIKIETISQEHQEGKYLVDKLLSTTYSYTTKNDKNMDEIIIIN